MSLTAQKVKLVAETQTSAVNLGDYFQITYTLKNADGKDFKFPPLNDFQVAGTSTGFKQYSINGRVSSEHNFIVSLIPKKAGNFTIPPASVVSSGKKYKSNAVKVRVKKGSNNSNSSGEGDLFVQAEISQEEAYIGQSVRLDFVLHSAQPVGRFEIVQLPKIEGVFVKDMQTFDVRNERRTIKGKKYATRLIHRMILYPQQEGKIQIDPITMRVALRNNFGYRTKSAFSKAIILDVKPLPRPTPDDFSGAVGEFAIRSQINKSRITTDETIILNIEISGKGDIKRIAPPQLNLSKDSFLVYDPRINETQEELDGELVYSKVFEYLISPKKAGTYDFAPTFNYFNVSTQQFETLEAEQPILTVLKGSGNVSNQTAQNATSNDIRYIKLKSSLYDARPFFGSIIFWMLLALPFLVLAALFFYKKKQTQLADIDPIVKKRRKANQVALKRLETAKQHKDQKDSRSFYDNISKTLWGFISDKLNIPASELSKNNIKTELLSKKVGEKEVEQFVKTIQNCEMALFAGMDNANSMETTYQSTVELITDLEEQI